MGNTTILAIALLLFIPLLMKLTSRGNKYGKLNDILLLISQTITIPLALWSRCNMDRTNSIITTWLCLILTLFLLNKLLNALKS